MGLVRKEVRLTIVQRILVVFEERNRERDRGADADQIVRPVDQRAEKRAGLDSVALRDSDVAKRDVVQVVLVVDRRILAELDRFQELGGEHVG